jgi:hypothetical protein
MHDECVSVDRTANDISRVRKVDNNSLVLFSYFLAYANESVQLKS